MRTRHLTLAATIAAAALTVGAVAASLTTPDERRDGASLAVYAASHLPAPSLDTIYTAPLKSASAAINAAPLTFTSAAIDQLPFSFSLASR
jgi:hypothetical protein